MRQVQNFSNGLSNGAYIYICGAKEPMSVDVEDTLMQIIRQSLVIKH